MSTCNERTNVIRSSGLLDSRMYEDVCLLGKILSHVDLSKDEVETLKEKFLRKDDGCK